MMDACQVQGGPVNMIIERPWLPRLRFYNSLASKVENTLGLIVVA